MTFQGDFIETTIGPLTVEHGRICGVWTSQDKCGLWTCGLLSTMNQSMNIDNDNTNAQTLMVIFWSYVGRTSLVILMSSAETERLSLSSALPAL